MEGFSEVSPLHSVFSSIVSLLIAGSSFLAFESQSYTKCFLASQVRDENGKIKIWQSQDCIILITKLKSSLKTYILLALFLF